MLAQKSIDHEEETLRMDPILDSCMGESIYSTDSIESDKKKQVKSLLFINRLCRYQYLRKTTKFSDWLLEHDLNTKTFEFL